jgi:hypothetical protein
MESRSVVVMVAVACLAIPACGNDDSSPPAQGKAPKEVTGPVVGIESEGLGDVRSFIVKSEDQTYEILIDPHVDYGFPLDHLNEHRLSGDPVRVELLERDGDLYAQSIVDA